MFQKYFKISCTKSTFNTFTMIKLRSYVITELIGYVMAIIFVLIYIIKVKHFFFGETENVYQIKLNE